MKIESQVWYGTEIEQWADHHNLEVECGERSLDLRQSMRLSRYHVAICGVEIVEGSFLKTTHGNGETVEDALLDYQRELSGQRVKINNHYYIQMPEFHV